MLALHYGDGRHFSPVIKGPLLKNCQCLRFPGGILHFFILFIYLGGMKGKKNPEVSAANHVGSRFSAAAQMTALNYAELFNWTAVVWFLLR